MKKDVKELLKKLQALAERGVGGEKETARNKLEKLLSENGLTEKDLLEDKVEYYLFSYQFSYLQKLLSQCIYRVVGAENFHLFKTKGTRNKIGAYCTAAQKVEIELDFEFYRSLFDEEVETLMSAFIAKQDIFPKDCKTTVLNPDDLSEEENERLRKIEAMKAHIDKKIRASAFLEDMGGK